MRLFLAINIPDTIKNVLVQELPRFDYLKYHQIPAQNWHITIKFIGDVQDDMVDSINEAVLPIAEQFKPFILKVKCLGFLNRRIFAIYLDWSDKLYALYNMIDQRLAARGIAYLEKRRHFIPHITIGRKNPPIQQDLHAVRHFALKTKQILDFDVKSVDLMKSELKPQGAEYQIVKKYQF